MFVSFEGIDGSGKSTTMSAVAEILKAHPYVHGNIHQYRAPGIRPATGPKFRELLLSPDSPLSRKATPLVFWAEMVDAAEQELIPLLLDGDTILMDRWVDSTFVYQFLAGKWYQAAPHRQQLADDLMHFAYRMVIMPTLTFILDLDPRAAKRKKEATANG